MDCHRPSAFAMTVCGVGSRNDEFCLTVRVSHNEIATSSTNSRNDGSFFCHCEE